MPHSACRIAHSVTSRATVPANSLDCVLLATFVTGAFPPYTKLISCCHISSSLLCTYQCFAPLVWIRAKVEDMWGFEHLKILIPTTYTWGHFLCQIPTIPLWTTAGIARDLVDGTRLASYKAEMCQNFSISKDYQITTFYPTTWGKVSVVSRGQTLSAQPLIDWKL